MMRTLILAALSAATMAMTLQNRVEARVLTLEPSEEQIQAALMDVAELGAEAAVLAMAEEN